MNIQQNIDFQLDGLTLTITDRQHWPTAVASIKLTPSQAKKLAAQLDKNARKTKKKLG